MSDGIAAAVREMDRRRAVQLESRGHRSRLDRAVRMVDAVIGELELLNLREQHALSPAAGKRLAAVLKLIPGDLCPPVSVGDSVQHLMDDLYDRLDSLLVRRSGPEWNRLRNEESEPLAS